MNLILSILVIFCSGLLTKAFCILAQNTRLMDLPNNRSLHQTPTVRGGGLVFIGLSLLSLPFLCNYTQTSLSDLWILIICIISLATVSFWDDLFTLAVKPRFLVHLLVAVLVACFMMPDQLNFIFFSITNPILIIPFLIIATLWSVNHFNFMDGLDGICAMQAVFLCASYAIFFGLFGSALYQDFCIILICSLIGFLFFNFPPARLFMGDVGSATLGLIVFCIALIAQKKFQLPIMYWFMLNALFLFDASITLLRRIINKEVWYTPHRKHAYQRLKQSGMNARWILFGQFVVNSFFLIIVALVQANVLNIAPALLIEMTLICLIYMATERKYPMFENQESV